MIALEVSRNGKRLVVAGVGNNGVLDAMVVWNGRPNLPAHAHLRVGGLNSTKNVFFEWMDRVLRVGDEVTIRVIEVDKPDPPRKTHPGFERAKQKKKNSRKQAN